MCFGLDTQNQRRNPSRSPVKAIPETDNAILCHSVAPRSTSRPGSTLFSAPQSEGSSERGFSLCTGFSPWETEASRRPRQDSVESIEGAAYAKDFGINNRIALSDFGSIESNLPYFTAQSLGDVTHDPLRGVVPPPSISSSPGTNSSTGSLQTNCTSKTDDHVLQSRVIGASPSVTRTLPLSTTAGYHQCPTCKKRFASRGQLHRHEREHRDPAFTCPVVDCGRTFKYEKDQNRHQETVHGAKAFICPPCSYHTSREDNFSRHVKSSLHMRRKYYKDQSTILS